MASAVRIFEGALCDVLNALQATLDEIDEYVTLKPIDKCSGAHVLDQIGSERPPGIEVDDDDFHIRIYPRSITSNQE